ncbi:hypothetical protein FKP32DRAFT_415572 [Trametes sanguinea]|nr:hypothetical protein FKP32DRAFT_415572 [Trametes sanguinea]
MSRITRSANPWVLHDKSQPMLRSLKMSYGHPVHLPPALLFCCQHGPGVSLSGVHAVRLHVPVLPLILGKCPRHIPMRSCTFGLLDDPDTESLSTLTDSEDPGLHGGTRSFEHQPVQRHMLPHYHSSIPWLHRCAGNSHACSIDRYPTADTGLWDPQSFS